MSLAFLSKKSWHTANLRNVEKVWIAEQKHAAEEKKVEELRKNIEEERQLQELRQLQAAHGDKSAAMERVEWMYEGPSASGEKIAEEYLLGKEYTSEGNKTIQEDVDLSTTSNYGSLALNKTTLPANDAFQRLHEDPMMLIRKRQQAAREQVLTNPITMKKVKDQVFRLKQDKKAFMKAKKAAKKEQKHALRLEKRGCKQPKHGRKNLDTSRCEDNIVRTNDRDSDDKRRSSRYRSRFNSKSSFRGRERDDSTSPSQEYYKLKRTYPFKSRRNRSSKKDQCYQSRSRSSVRCKHRDRSRSFQGSTDVTRELRACNRRNRRSRSPSSRYEPRRVRNSFDRQNRRRSRSYDRKYDHEKARSPTRRQRGRSYDSSISRDRTREFKTTDRLEKDELKRKPLENNHTYGLLRQRGAVEAKNVDKTSLGPNKNHLAKAREVKRLDEADCRRKLGKTFRRGFCEITDEEMKKRAEQMVEDAKQREEYIVKRGRVKKDELDTRESEVMKSNPEFLRKLHSEAYMDNERNMSDRIRRNVHYIQKKADAAKFLSK
ncbi:hypothetical protein CCR75_006275 [Bremia lactucae]|uniref:CBF1-interacting co-repressor CIR N-terminal domain-containing protein n=1 Tax=Bremia lactucae TaxID=4779 RepID=A0A976FG70_BRELC|nr:hypothetical protein CCR75_006275 [Bremia lactucae]